MYDQDMEPLMLRRGAVVEVTLADARALSERVRNVRGTANVDGCLLCGFGRGASVG